MKMNIITIIIITIIIYSMYYTSLRLFIAFDVRIWRVTTIKPKQLWKVAAASRWAHNNNNDNNNNDNNNDNTYTYICIHTYIHTYVFVYIYIYTYTHTYIHIYIYTHMCVCMHACMYVCMLFFARSGATHPAQFGAGLPALAINLPCWSNSIQRLHKSLGKAKKVCMYVCMHVCMYVCMCMYIYIYIYMERERERERRRPLAEVEVRRPHGVLRGELQLLCEYIHQLYT